jgi:chromate reductase, NAD(P)H dehydrogenase (quinone)
VRILAICGSLQASSENLRLLRLAATNPPAGVEVLLFDGIRDLPNFNPDLEAGGVPEAVRLWRAALAGSGGVLIACPEYGHSLPGSLKNAIDWVIGSGELYGKAVAITAAVSARERGRRGLSALRQTLEAVSASIVSEEPIPKGPTFEREVTELVRLLSDSISEKRTSP